MTKQSRLSEALRKMDFYELAKITLEEEQEQDEN